MKSGVYKITNIINGMFYIGSSNDIRQRWNEHRSDLRRKIHSNIKLQHAWNFYGEDKFTFELIEETESTQSFIFEREQHYLNILKPHIREIGYNLSDKATGGDHFTNNPRKEEIRRKLREMNLGEKNPMFNKNHTNDTIEKQKGKAKGRYTLEWCIKRYGEEDGKKKYQEIILQRAKRPKSVYRKSIPKENFINSFKGKKHKDGWLEKRNKTVAYFRDNYEEFKLMVLSGQYSQRQLARMIGTHRNIIKKKVEFILGQKNPD